MIRDETIAKYHGEGAVIFTHDKFHSGDFVSSSHVVTSVRVIPHYSHDRVIIFNRDGNSGEILVDRGDGEEIARRLLLDEGEYNDQG